MRSELEAALVWQIRAVGLPAPTAEHRFAPPRRWRFDLAWPDRKLAVEIDGGSWVGGRHTCGAGYAADCAKGNAATLGGWRVLHFTGDMVTDGTALAMVEQALR